MDERDRAGTFDHLFAGTVRDAVEGSTYGAWRAISAPEAASLSFGFPFPEAFPTEELATAAREVLDENPEGPLQYGGSEDIEQLVEGIARRAEERGIDADEETIMVTAGATHAVDAVCRTFLEPGDAVFLGVPTFMGTLYVFENYGVEVVGFEIDADGVDVEAIAEALHARREEGRPIPKLLYTIPNFQNPTGATLSLDRRRRLLELAEEFDFVIVEDDAYGELRYDGEDVPPLAALDETGRVVHVGSFSKTIAPGVRTGYAIAHEEILDGMELVDSGGTNTFVRTVLGRYFAEGHYEANLEELRAAYGDRRDHMLGCLDEHLPEACAWSEPDGGFFVWVELPEGLDAEELLSEAAEEGVTYLPGSMFYPDGRGERCLRLSFSYVPYEEMERGVQAIARSVRSALEE